MPRDSEHVLSELGLSERRPPCLYRSPEELTRVKPNGYTHVLSRAWKYHPGLAGVLFSGSHPAAFIQVSESRGSVDLVQQRRFWSNGVASILLRVTPDAVRAYTALQAPALTEDEVDSGNRLLRTFERTSRALELQAFVRSIELGTVYDEYPTHFDPAQAVDRQLLENLRAARHLMASGRGAPSLPSIHRLLGRILFSCYLFARGALLPRDFGRLGAGSESDMLGLLSLSSLKQRRWAVSRLFARLGRYFGGDLFDETLADDLDSLRSRDLNTLRDLLAGTELRTGQRVLPFSVYDFSVIPIETISAIYEDFVHSEDSGAAKQFGVFYTPPKLAAFVTDLAVCNDDALASRTVLDPACGSGVFLVSMFNRMAQTWVFDNPSVSNGARAAGLRQILQCQLCGIDVSEIACQATCFSLYMAFLDFLEPPEIRQLGKGALPVLRYSESSNTSHDPPYTVIRANFLDLPAHVADRKFDYIVGNPPWVSRRKPMASTVNMWRLRYPDADYPVPAGQVAYAFMWQSLNHLRDNGAACLLLPAKTLFGEHTNEFQRKWFGTVSVDTVAQLSDLRFFLFEGAHHPTIAMRYGPTQRVAPELITLLTPKTSRKLLLDNIIALEPDDHKHVSREKLLDAASRGEAPICWLSADWATPRDREFLERLRGFPQLRTLVEGEGGSARWLKGQGFQPHGQDEGKRPAFWRSADRYVDASSAFELLLGGADTQAVGSRFRHPHRARDPRIYKAPLVLFNKGFTQIGFAPFDVLFQDCFQAISGPCEDSSLLQLLTAVLSSRLAAYFMFHMSSGTHYRTPLLSEVLRMPFPTPRVAPGAEASRHAEAIVRLLAGLSADPRFGGFGHDEAIDEAKRLCDRHVMGYFDVSDDEEVLIDDAVRYIQPSIQPSRRSTIPLLEVPSRGERKDYANTLVATLGRWGGGRQLALQASATLAVRAGLAVVSLRKGDQGVAYGESHAIDGLGSVIARLRDQTAGRAGSLVQFRNLAVLDGESVHIVKPLNRRYWLRTAALNDADQIASHLVVAHSHGATA